MQGTGQSQSHASRGYLIAIVAVAFWSTTAIFISYLMTHYPLPPLQLALWRFALVCVGLAGGLCATRRTAIHLERTHVPFLVVYGFELGVYSATWTLAVKLDGAAVSTVLVYSSAAFTALLARWLYRERLRPPKIMAVVVSLVGCVLVSGAHDPRIWRINPLGIAVGLLSGLLFAVYNLMGRESAQRQLDSWSAMFFSFLLAALFLLLFNLVPALRSSGIAADRIWPTLPWRGWLVLLTLSLVPTLFGYGLYNASMRYLPVSTVNLLATVEPVMTAAQAYLLLGERMTMPQILGSALIIVALLVVRLKETTTVLHNTG